MLRYTWWEIQVGIGIGKSVKYKTANANIYDRNAVKDFSTGATTIALFIYFPLLHFPGIIYSVVITLVVDLIAYINTPDGSYNLNSLNVGHFTTSRNGGTHSSYIRVTAT